STPLVHAPYAPPRAWPDPLRRTDSARPAPSPRSRRPHRRSECWPPRRRPAATPSPAAPADAAPTARELTPSTHFADQRTSTTVRLVQRSSIKTTNQPHTYSDDTPLGGCWPRPPHGTC